MDQSEYVQWKVGDVLRQSWNILINNPNVFLGGGAIIVIGGSVLNIAARMPGIIVGALLKHSSPLYAGILHFGITFVLAMLVATVQMFFTMGYIRASLMAVRGQRPEFGVLFSAGPYFLKGFWTTLLAGVASLIATLFFIIPGIYTALGLFLVQYVIIDLEGKIGVVDSMRESWRLTNGRKGALFVWALTIFGLAIAGMLTCCMGLLVSTPLTLIGTTIIYEKLARAKNTAEAAPAAG